MVSRFAGDFSGNCSACNEYVEFALGIRPGTDPVAMRFGPGGPEPIELQNVNLDLMVDDTITVRLSFVCPLCGKWSTGRVTCTAMARPDSLDD